MSRLIKRLEWKKFFECENCGKVAPLSQWLDGWLQGGRSRKLIPPDRGYFFACWCSQECYDIPHVNPTEEQIKEIRKQLTFNPEGMVSLHSIACDCEGCNQARDIERIHREEGFRK